MKTALVLFLVGITVSVFAQGYKLTWFDHKDGLTQSSVSEIFQSDDGFIWLSGQAGILRFDGKNFKYLGDPAGKARFMQGMARFDDSTYITGTQDGEFYRFSSFSNSLERMHCTVDASVLNMVWYDSVLYACNWQNGVIAWNGRSFEQVKLPEARSMAATYLYEHDGLLYVSRRNDVCVFDGTSWRTIPLPAFTGTIVIGEAPDGTLLFGTRRSGVLQLNGERFSSYIDADKFEGATVHAMLVDEEDGLILATSAGVYRQHNGEVTLITRLFENRHYSTLLLDTSGALWAGTFGHGLLKISRDKLRSFTTRDGLPENTVYPIRQANGGKIYAGTINGLAEYDGASWKSYFVQDGLANNTVYGLETTPDDKLLTASVGRVQIFDGTTFRDEESLRPWFGELIHTITRAQDGSLSMGTVSSGILFYDWNTVEQMGEEDGLSSNSTVMSITDTYGNKWFANTKTGIDISTPNGWIRYNTDNLLPNDYVSGLAEYRPGEVWATTLNGVCIFYGTKLVDTLTTEDGLAHNLTYFVKTDYPMAYIGTTEGFCVFDGDRFITYTTDDGLASNDTNAGAIFEDAEGKIWIGTMGGLTVYDPTLDQPAVMQPEAYLSSLEVNHIPADVESIRFAYDDAIVLQSVEPVNVLKLKFGALNSAEPERLMFRCRINGGKWLYANAEGTFEIAGLELDDVQLDYQVRQFRGEWQPAAAALTIERSGFGKYSTLYALLVWSVLAGLAFAFFRSRNGRKRQANGNGIAEGTVKETWEKVNTAFSDNGLHRDPELTLQSLAVKLEIQKEYISRAVNKYAGVNFNTFINTRRVEDARDRLLSPDEEQFTILKIAHDVGFNSKTAFNTNFKKITGMTPSEYRSSKKEEVSARSAKKQG